MAANMQRLAALRADLLRLWQFMHDLLYRQAGEVHFPLPLLFPPLLCDLLQFGLRYVLIFQRFRLIEQRNLLHCVKERLPFGGTFLIRFHWVIIQEQQRKCNIFPVVPPAIFPP